jgi:hypothetical protein
MNISQLVHEIRGEQICVPVTPLIYPSRIQRKAKCSANISLNVQYMKRRYLHIGLSCIVRGYEENVADTSRLLSGHC